MTTATGRDGDPERDGRGWSSSSTTLAERAYSHSDLPPTEAERLRQRVRERAIDLMDEWARVAQDYQKDGVGLQYNPSETGAAKQLLHDFLSTEVKNLPPRTGA